MEQIRLTSSCVQRTHGAVHISTHVEVTDHERVVTLTSEIKARTSEFMENIYENIHSCISPVLLNKNPEVLIWTGNIQVEVFSCSFITWFWNLCASFYVDIYSTLVATAIRHVKRHWGRTGNYLEMNNLSIIFACLWERLGVFLHGWSDLWTHQASVVTYVSNWKSYSSLLQLVGDCQAVWMFSLSHGLTRFFITEKNDI